MNIDTIIDVCAAKLQDGNTILYPTDTIWGLGCDATQHDAVERIYSIKQRPIDKPMILLVDSVDMLKNYVEQIHPRIETLLMYHQRPLTLIYNQAKNLPQISFSKDGTVAIRISNDDFSQALIRKFGKPIISTSANISDETTPSFYHEISTKVKDLVDYIVPYGQEDTTIKDPSVIARLDLEGNLELIRP